MERKEKEIEEMTQDFIKLQITTRQGVETFAKQLYDMGYRKTFTSELASETQKAYKDGYKKGFDTKLTSDFVRYAQKEAVKEFAEKLKRECRNFYPSIDHYCCSEKAIKLADVDKLLKEFLE